MTRCTLIGLVTFALVLAPAIELSARGSRGGGGRGGSQGSGRGGNQGGGRGSNSGGYSGRDSRGASQGRSTGRSPSMSGTGSSGSRDRGSDRSSMDRTRPGTSGGSGQDRSRRDTSGGRPSTGNDRGGSAFERTGDTPRPSTGQDRPSSRDRAAGGTADSRERGPGERSPSDRNVDQFLDLPRDGDVGHRDAVVDRRENRPERHGERRPNEGEQVAERRDRVPDRREETAGNRTDRLNDRGNQVRREARQESDVFSDQWRDQHAASTNNRWRYAEGQSASYWRQGGTWAGVTGWVAGTSSEPVYYDYGNTTTYEDGEVYQDGEPVVSAEEYAQQAQQIAQTPVEETPETAEWMPLGVFAMVREKDSKPTMFLELAVSKEGTIAGTYSNTTSDSAQPVEGSVDKQSQRAAWWIGDNQNNILETGIYNLTQEETPVLVHFGSEQTQTWLLVRLEESAPE